MTSGDVMDGCASAGRNQDRGSVRKNGPRKRFAARGVPTLSVLSDSVSTGSSGMDGTSLLLMERYNVC